MPISGPQIGSVGSNLGYTVTAGTIPVGRVHPRIGRSRSRCRWLSYSILLLWILFLPGTALTKDAVVGKEYRVKAAFLYNFIRFVDWPEDKMPKGSDPMVVGVIGKDPFGKELEIIARKPVKGKKLVVRNFSSLSQVRDEDIPALIEQMQQSHLVFVSASEKEHWSLILPDLAASAALTVSEVDGFLKAGGMIRFVREGTKGRFVIHLKNTRQARLDIRAKLLRLAKNVIEK